MGFVSLVCTASLAFFGHRHCIQSLQGHCSHRCRTICHEASPDGGKEQPTLSSNNRTAAEEDGVLKSEAAKNDKKNDDLDSLGLTSAPERRSLLTDEKRSQIGMARGVAYARKHGHYTRYPGVHFNKAYGKWRVKFSHKGNIHRAGAAHATEKEAALAHDEFVRKHKMNRPLHFPMEGEPSSLVASKLDGIPIEERQQLSAELSIRNHINLGHKTHYSGVTFQKASQKWKVEFTFKGKKHYGGLYKTEEEAALAHDEYVRKLGLNRPLLFPQEGERTCFVDDEAA